jgi:1-acyl-sn-glycerol-3-phosphate acyltransferase
MILKYVGFKLISKKLIWSIEPNWTIFGGPIWIYGYKIDTHLFERGPQAKNSMNVIVLENKNSFGDTILVV